MAKALDLVQNIVPPKVMDKADDVLCEMDEAELDAALRALQVDAPGALDAESMAGIDAVSGGDDGLEGVLSRLNSDPSDFATSLRRQLPSWSPNSLGLIWKLLVMARGADLRTCLDNELACAAEAIHHPDFIEGVRAVLVDKDRSPRWRSTAPFATPA